MKLKELIKELQEFEKENPEAEIIFSQDEEGNAFMSEATLQWETDDKKIVDLFPDVYIN